MGSHGSGKTHQCERLLGQLRDRFEHKAIRCGQAHFSAVWEKYSENVRSYPKVEEPGTSTK